MDDRVSLSKLDAELKGTATGRSISLFETGGLADEVDSNFRPTAKDLYVWSTLQKQLFLNRGISGFQLASIHEKEDEVIKQALALDLDKGEIPFVWVPSSHLVSIPTLMNMIIGHDRMVTYAGPTGYTRLDPRKLSDCIDTPDSHSLWYAIFKVRNDFVDEHNRSFLTAREVMAVCVCTSILEKQNMVAVNSSYGPSNQDQIGRVALMLSLSKQGPSLLEMPDLKPGVVNKCTTVNQSSCRGRL